VAAQVTYPCVVKPVFLSTSRGVMRADNGAEFVTAVERLSRILAQKETAKRGGAAAREVLAETFIPGREVAVEGLLTEGSLRVLTIFDKPDPLDGPYFEETIYRTPSAAPGLVQRAIVDEVGRAAAALGLRHGPIHAECRVNDRGVFVLEVAARPIGGLCARALRFEHGVASREIDSRSLEELLMRHALGEAPDGWSRESSASGVMMIPIPRRGIFRRVTGIDEARRVEGVEDVRITAKPDQLLVPLPEGASYLGFIFARGARGADVEDALRASHRLLHFTIDPELAVLQSLHG